MSEAEAIVDGPRQGAATATTAVVGAAAVACGAIVANLYYAQPLVDLIARDLAIPETTASSIVALTQIGYGAGLIFLAPLVDRFESRRLLTTTLAFSCVALLVAALAGSAGLFFAAMLAVGVTSVAAQMLLPLVAGMAPEARRGQIIGTVMSGLLFGILLARPVAGVVADLLGWRAMFALSAVFMAITALALRAIFPSRIPDGGMPYLAFVGSMFELLKRHEPLRRRSALQAAMFASFSIFWTAAPIRLASAYGWSHSMIGLFALGGAAGALVAPLAGKFADGGRVRGGTLAAAACAVAGFAIAGADAVLGWWALLAAAILVDVGVQANMIFGQRTIFGLDAEARGRINGIYVASLFAGGAVGSVLTSPVLAHFGWVGLAAMGAAAPLLAGVAAFFIEPSTPSSSPAR